VRRPVSTWLLIASLIVLALGGLAGAYGFLSDPTGSGMGMTAQLERLPVSDFVLPGVFLLLAMFLLPLVLVFGLLTRRAFGRLEPLAAWSDEHWAWVGSLALGLGLALWLMIQAFLIGFSAPIQWFTALLDVTILVTTLVKPTRSYYLRAPRGTSRASL
jgi:hypothetical protein